MLRVPLEPIHLALAAGSAIVLDALVALQEHFSQDLEWHIVINASGGLFRIRDCCRQFRPAQLATLGLFRTTEQQYAFFVPQASSILRMDAPYQEVDARAVMQGSSRRVSALAVQTHVNCAQRVPTHS